MPPAEEQPPAGSRRVVAAVAAAVLVATAAVLITIGVRAQTSPPQPPAAAPSAASSESAPNGSATTTDGPSTRPPTGAPTASSPRVATPPASKPSPPIVLPRLGPSPTGLALSRSVPTSIDIPAIGVHSPLLQLGQDSTGAIDVPPLDQVDSQAGWYTKSPTPGQLGPSIILGHVDSAKHGPAVFFRLGALRPADTISVDRTDGMVAVFRVDSVASYGKDAFPTDQVYGNIDHAGLRLITCGGVFDAHAGSYESNIVVYASLVSAHHR